MRTNIKTQQRAEMTKFWSEIRWQRDNEARIEMRVQVQDFWKSERLLGQRIETISQVSLTWLSFGLLFVHGVPCGCFAGACSWFHIQLSDVGYVNETTLYSFLSRSHRCCKTLLAYLLLWRLLVARSIV